MLPSLPEAPRSCTMLRGRGSGRSPAERLPAAVAGVPWNQGFPGHGPPALKGEACGEGLRQRESRSPNSRRPCPRSMDRGVGFQGGRDTVPAATVRTASRGLGCARSAPSLCSSSAALQPSAGRPRCPLCSPGSQAPPLLPFRSCDTARHLSPVGLASTSAAGVAAPWEPGRWL